jgi:hypothetical protein
VGDPPVRAPGERGRRAPQPASLDGEPVVEVVVVVVEPVVEVAVVVVEPVVEVAVVVAEPVVEVVVAVVDPVVEVVVAVVDPVVEVVAVPLVELVAVGVPPPAVVEAISVARLTATSFSGWTKTTVSEPVFASRWTCTSATNAGGSPHGRLPTGPAVPASWVTVPRNR